MQGYSRRSVLTTLAIGAGALPLLPRLGRHLLSNAHAAETGAPRRIILFENPNGLPAGNGIPDSWFFKRGADDTIASGTLGYVLQPLARHAADMVVIQNLEQKNRPIKDTSAHNNYSIQLYTGSAEGEGPDRPSWGKARNASIDFHMSEKIGKVVTPQFPFLGVGVQPDQSHLHDYAGTQVRGSIQADPYVLFAKLFSNLVTGNTGPDPALLKRLADRKSVLDYVAKDIAPFRARLGAEDRARADVQLDAIRTLEQRLSAAANGTTAPACSAPILPPGIVSKSHISVDVPQLFSMMTDIVATAFACDLSRVCQWLNWGRDDHDTTCQFEPVNTVQGWHSLSHLDPDIESYKRAKVWMGGNVAALADKLKSIPEAGGTMLDNTLIVMASEHGQDHAGWPMQFCTIGGKNLGVKTGRYIKAGEPRPGMGIEHNRLLVSLLNAMGLPDETWGIQDSGRGPLDGFQ